MLDGPARLARHRVPGDQLALVHGLDGLDLGGVVGKGVRQDVGADVPGPRLVLEVLDVGVGEGRGVGRDIDQALLRVERHGMPVVGAQGPRQGHGGGVLVACALDLDGSAGLQVDALGPGDRGVGVGRDQLPGGPVDHVEETVLRGLHQHLAGLAADVQVRQHDVLGGRVVPALARGRLVVPDILARVRLEGQDGRDEQVVALAVRALLVVPGRAVADAEVDDVQGRVIGHGVPDGRAAAGLLPGLAEPGA